MAAILLLGLLLLVPCATSSVEWELLAEGDLSAGLHDPHRPMKRYGSALQVFDEESLLSFGGYFFDVEHSTPMWLDDWWYFDMKLGHWEERRLSAAGTQVEPRYKMSTCVLKERRMVMFGGGAVDSRRVLGDLVVIDTLTRTAKVLPQLGGEASKPRPRHSAVMGRLTESSFVLYGGMDGLGALDDATYLATGLDESCVWAKMEPAAHTLMPLPRRSPLLLPLRGDRIDGLGSTKDFLLFGGFGSNPKNMNDVWLLTVAVGSLVVRWTSLHDGSGVAPPPRGAAVGAVDSGDLYVALGAACALDCTTLGDVWKFHVESRTWKHLTTDPYRSPVPRQYAAFALVSAPSRLIVFGGESFRPYGYWNDVWALHFDADDNADNVSRASPLTWHTAGSTHNRQAMFVPVRPPGAVHTPHILRLIGDPNNPDREQLDNVVNFVLLAVGVLFAFSIRFQRRSAVRPQKARRPGFVHS